MRRSTCNQLGGNKVYVRRELFASHHIAEHGKTRTAILCNPLSPGRKLGNEATRGTHRVCTTVALLNSKLTSQTD